MPPSTFDLTKPFLFYITLVSKELKLQASRGVQASSLKKSRSQMAPKFQPSTTRPAFFKALRVNFSRQLRIPPAFYENLKGCSRHCRLKGPSGTCFDVEMEKRGKLWFFHRGWEKFVQRYPLEVADFLVFRYDGNSEFDVTIYDNSFCEKYVEAANRRSEVTENGGAATRGPKSRKRARYTHADKKEEVENAEDLVLPFRSKNRFVYRTLGNYSLSEVYVPRQVVKNEGYKAGMTLKIQDTYGMSWNVILGGNQQGRLLMRLGLPNICRANGARPGDTLIFEFVDARVVQLHVIKKRA